jgi:hypothetical protein
MKNRIPCIFLIASLFFGGGQASHAEDTDVQVLIECAQAVGSDPSLVRKTTIPPGTPCATEAYEVTVSIGDGRLGYMQHVRFPAGIAHQRVRAAIDKVDVMETMHACQKVSPDGRIVSEWFVKKGSNCAGREAGSSLYRRYLREKNPDTDQEEVRVCLVLSQTKSECRPLTWFVPEAQARVRTSLARADQKLARMKEEHSRLASLNK